MFWVPWIPDIELDNLDTCIVNPQNNSKLHIIYFIYVYIGCEKVKQCSQSYIAIKWQSK